MRSERRLNRKVGSIKRVGELERVVAWKLEGKREKERMKNEEKGEREREPVLKCW